LRRQTRFRRRLGLRATSPEATEEIAVPTQQRLRLDQDQGVAPVGEYRSEADEDEPVGGAQLGALRLARSDEKLVTQEGVLGEKLTTGPCQVQHQALDWALFSCGCQGTTQDAAGCQRASLHQAANVRTEPVEHMAMEPRWRCRW
jgi:hypothetical protein